MRLSFRIAWRFIKSSRGQSFLIIAGITIGVAVQIFIGLLIQGLQANLVQETIGNSSQITLRSTRKDDLIISPDEVVKNIRESPYADEIESVLAVSDTPGIIRLDERDYSAFLRGFDLKEGNKIYDFDNTLIRGDLPDKQGEVIIGNEMAKELSLEPGDTIKLVIPPVVILPKTVTVSGIFQFGLGQANRTWMISDLKTVQNLRNKPNTASSIEMQIEEPFQADVLATKLMEHLKNDALNALDWKEENADLLSALNGQSISSIVIRSLLSYPLPLPLQVFLPSAWFKNPDSSVS